MGSVNALLDQRLKKSSQTSKMAEMARQSVQGNLSGFAGIFSVTELNGSEKELLRTILKEHAQRSQNIESDLASLAAITSEVKAINNQAAILHGERIKKAHSLLSRYRDGAFTAWMLAAYGNRQTPYNFLQYYEFYENLPGTLRPKLESMPRQAVYTLASRQIPLSQKQKFVEAFAGETKAVLLEKIRIAFPIDKDDKRAGNPADSAIRALERAAALLRRKQSTLTKSQKEAIRELIDEMKSYL